MEQSVPKDTGFEGLWQSTSPNKKYNITGTIGNCVVRIGLMKKVFAAYVVNLGAPVIVVRFKKKWLTGLLVTVASEKPIIQWSDGSIWKKPKAKST